MVRGKGKALSRSPTSTPPNLEKGRACARRHVSERRNAMKNCFRASETIDFVSPQGEEGGQGHARSAGSGNNHVGRSFGSFLNFARAGGLGHRHGSGFTTALALHDHCRRAATSAPGQRSARGCAQGKSLRKQSPEERN